MASLDVLRTARLAGRRMRTDDFDFVLRMNRDEQVMAFLGGAKSEDQTRESFVEVLGQWERLGYGVYVLSDAATGALVGRAGLRRREIDGAMETDLGYMLLPEAWGKGYASEIGAALLKLGFEEIGLESIVAYTAPGNAASRHVMEKLGFRYETEFSLAGAPRVLYRASRTCSGRTPTIEAGRRSR